MDKKSFVIYQNWAKLIQNLENEKAGILIKAICMHVNGADVVIEDEDVFCTMILVCFLGSFENSFFF